MTSSTCAAPVIQLRIGDLSEVQDVLTPVSHKCIIFGSKISVPHHILAGIEETNYDFDKKLYKVLEYRLKQLPLLTWHDIVRALRSPAVHEQVLASEIESQYISCSSSQSQLVTSNQSSASIDPDSGANIFFQTQPPFGQHPQSPPHRALKGKQKCSHGSSSQANSCTIELNPFESLSLSTQTLMPGAPSAKRPHLKQGSSPPLSNVDSGRRALFQQFTESVKSFYKFSPVEVRTQVLKLPTAGKKFINLACIDRKTKGLRTEYDEITEAMVRDGNVDVIEGRKCPIYMNEIAANLPATTFETVILVEGAPGVGKSTFAWEFCRRWERGEIAQQYDLVLLLQLRDDRISKAKCWKDLIYHSSPSILQTVISELEARSGFGVLFILEGYDELPDECRHPSSPLLKLISGEELHLATLIITSRPWATCDVLKRFKHRIFQHIEVLGFTKSQISSYIQSVLSEEEVKDLKKKLLKHGQIKKCMYIPLNCAIVVTVFQESKASGDNMPSTMTELYLAVSRTILLRYLRANDAYSNPIECFEELPPGVHKKFKYLCKLAYSSIAEAGDQVRLIFTNLPPDFDGLGFTDSVFELYVTRKAVASHNFLHLTFQEFLASVHISNMEAEQRLQHFKRHKEGRLRVVLRFLAGLTKLKDFNTLTSFVSLLDQPRKCGYTALDYTIRPHVCSWVYEALGKEMIKTAFHENITLEFVCDNLTDSAALGYCITHNYSKCVLSVSGRMGNKDIDILVDESQASDSSGGVIVGLRGGFDKHRNTFKGLSVSFTELNHIFTGLHIRLSELALKLPSKCTQISWPDLSSLQSLTIDTTTYKEDETMSLELGYLLPQLFLSSLTLWSPSSLSFEDIKAVANYITNRSTLKYLHIFVGCPLIGLNEIFAAIIENELCPNFTLEILDECKIDSDDAENLANYIRTTALSKLVFSDLEFSVFGALQVARALRTVPDLITDKLYFVVRKQSDFSHAIELINDYSDLLDKQMCEFSFRNVSISLLLPDSTTSECGFNVNIDVDDDVVEHLADALRNNSLVRALRLHGIFFISDVGAKTLVETINCNTILEELELSSSSSVSTEALAKAIRSNTALRKLNLYCNIVGDVGLKALAEVLNCNNILEEIVIFGCNIGSVGAEVLAEAIGSNTALKKLDLSRNDVGDVGAIALAHALHSNSSVEVLHLSLNGIGDSGAKAFAEALHHNSTITHLDLCANKDIGEEGVHHLIQALTVNDSISENGLTLDSKGFECALNCSGYRYVEYKIKWWCGFTISV